MKKTNKKQLNVIKIMAKIKSKKTKSAAVKSQLAIAAPISAEKLAEIQGVNETPIVPITGEVEATPENIKADETRANGENSAQDALTVEVDNTTLVMVDDELTSMFGNPWRHNGEDIKQELQLRDDSNVLNRFEYQPEKLMAGGKPSRYSILRCSDNGLLVGKPFAGSYSLLDNSGFIAVIESICAVLDKMGLKWRIATTGSQMERERTFISICIEEGAEFKIGERVFQAFLNGLNSIPSNQGCTVTFANNTFCVCCRNTFAMILHDKEGAKFHAAIKHTKGMKAALGDIPKLVECYFSGNQELFKTLKAFSEFPVNATEAEQYFAAFIGGDSALTTRSAGMVDKLKELHIRGKGNKGETALDLFSAVTEYYTHFSAGQTEDKAKQYQSSEVGSGAVNKGAFYSWLVKHVQDKSAFQAVAKVGDTLLVNYRKAKTA